MNISIAKQILRVRSILTCSLLSDSCRQNSRALTRQAACQVTTKGHKFRPRDRLGGSAVRRKAVQLDGQTVLSSGWTMPLLLNRSDLGLPCSAGGSGYPPKCGVSIHRD